MCTNTHFYPGERKRSYDSPTLRGQRLTLQMAHSHVQQANLSHPHRRPRIPLCSCWTIPWGDFSYKAGSSSLCLASNYVGRKSHHGAIEKEGKLLPHHSCLDLNKNFFLVRRLAGSPLFFPSSPSQTLNSCKQLLEEFGLG